MGLKYRLLLGTVLLLVSWQATPSLSQNFQPEVDSSLSSSDKNYTIHNNIFGEKLRKPNQKYENNTTNDKTLQKTDESTEFNIVDNKDIDNKTSVSPSSQIENQIENVANVKTELAVKKENKDSIVQELKKDGTKTEALKEQTNHDGKKNESDETNIEDARYNNGRSIDIGIDIDKYVSPEFHNRNNVYTLPSSQDYEKYMSSDLDDLSSTYRAPDYLHEHYKFDSDLTTPKTEYFDNKFKQAVENINQKLELIDEIEPEYSKEKRRFTESDEHLNLEDLIEDSKDNETKTNLDYKNFKKITSNDKPKDKYSKTKDLVIEEGTNLNFVSSYNKTDIIDDDTSQDDTSEDDTSEENQQDNLVSREVLADQPDSESGKHEIENIATVAPKPIFSTRKSTTVITKPSSSENKSHIISNNIETESVLTKIGIGSTTEDPGSNGLSDSLEKTTPDNSKKPNRGSVKYEETLTSTQASIAETRSTFKKPRNKTLEQNKINKTLEQAVQENQVIPVQITAPASSDNYKIDSLARTEKVSIPVTSSESNVEKTSLIKPKIMNTATTASTNVDQSIESGTIIPSIKSGSKTDDEDTPTTSILVPSTTETSESEAATLTSFETVTKTSPTDGTSTMPNSDTEFTTVEQRVSETTTFGQEIISTSKPEMTTETSTRFETTQFGTTPVILTTEEPTTVEISTPESTQISSNDTRFTETTTEENTRSSKLTIPVENTTAATTTEFSTRESTTTFITVPITEYTTVISTKENTETPATPSTEKTATEITPLTSTATSHSGIHLNLTTFFPESNYTQPTGQGRSATPPETTTIEDNTTTVTAPSTVDGLTNDTEEGGKGTVIAIAISSVGCICLVLLASLLFIMKKRQKRFNYPQRCTPIGLDDYSVDNVSVYNSGRRKGALRASKRSYGNPAFDDPSSVSHPLNFPAISTFSNNLDDIKAEFEDIPQIIAKTSELPEGCDAKNRYANVIPLPETRVFLIANDAYPNSDYINANFVTGAKNKRNYYIATQAPMENTVDDFWRMVWEQQSKVILMLTQLYENGVEKCFDYLPPSEVLDCHRLFGDYQVTLKKREVKDKYIISSLQLKNMVSNSWREVTHFWYLGWPEKGVPQEANSLIAFLIEARSYMKGSTLDKREVTNGNVANGGCTSESPPVVVHCSPGTGRTGTVISCDIAIREFELSRLVDVPKIVYKIRRDRASSVQTKEQYAFIYKVINLYATKLTGGALDSL